MLEFFSTIDDTYWCRKVNELFKSCFNQYKSESEEVIYKLNTINNVANDNGYDLTGISKDALHIIIKNIENIKKSLPTYGEILEQVISLSSTEEKLIRLKNSVKTIIQASNLVMENSRLTLEVIYMCNCALMEVPTNKILTIVTEELVEQWDFFPFLIALCEITDMIKKICEHPLWTTFKSTLGKSEVTRNFKPFISYENPVLSEAVLYFKIKAYLDLIEKALPA